MSWMSFQINCLLLFSMAVMLVEPADGSSPVEALEERDVIKQLYVQAVLSEFSTNKEMKPVLRFQSWSDFEADIFRVDRVVINNDIALPRQITGWQCEFEKLFMHYKDDLGGSSPLVFSEHAPVFPMLDLRLIGCVPSGIRASPEKLSSWREGAGNMEKILIDDPLFAGHEMTEFVKSNTDLAIFLSANSIKIGQAHQPNVVSGMRFHTIILNTAKGNSIVYCEDRIEKTGHEWSESSQIKLKNWGNEIWFPQTIETTTKINDDVYSKSHLELTDVRFEVRPGFGQLKNMDIRENSLVLGVPDDPEGAFKWDGTSIVEAHITPMVGSDVSSVPKSGSSVRMWILLGNVTAVFLILGFLLFRRKYG